MENNNSENPQKEVSENPNPHYKPKLQVPEGMSKRAYKKELKQQKWLEKRDEQKLKQKDKKKKSKTQHAHLQRFNNLTKENTEQEAQPKLQKKDKLLLFKELCDKGPKYIIDCEFDDYMTDRELKSLGQQLAYCYSTNKRLQTPINIFMTGIGERLHSFISRQSCENWAANLTFGTEGSYEQLFKDQKDKLVYLTADSENLIEDLDQSMIYIIGGIVDHNRHKLLTFNKAKEQGIKHGRLPIRENVILETSCVLTVNHVFDIIAKYLECKNWMDALKKAIPERKVKKFADEGEEEVKQE